MMTFNEYLYFKYELENEDTLTMEEWGKYYDEYCNSEYYNGEKGL